MTHIHTTKKAAVVFAVVAVLAIFLPTLEIPLNIGNVLNATSIFYSVLLGFYIASAMTNLSRLKSLVAIETGGIISVYHLCKIALPNKLDTIRESIDRYLIKRFDYEVSDYTEPTTEEFFAIFDVLKGADPKSAGEVSAMNYIAEAHYYIAQARREITIVGAKIVSGTSWVVLNLLSFMIVLMIFLMRDGGIASTIVTIFLSSSAIISLFILDDVDGNRFGEEKFSVETYQAVFKAIGNLPYYPHIFVLTSRYKPKEKVYRTGTSAHIIQIGHAKS